MKICTLFQILIIIELIQIRFTERTFYHWQCSLLLPDGITIRSLVEQNYEAFRVVGWPEWMIAKYNYIDCSQKGLENIPKGLNTDVQILDLGRNSITHIRENDFAMYKNLVAISLIKNCIKSDFYTAAIRRCSTYLTVQKGALSNLNNLRYLALSSTVMKQLPEMLPSKIRVLLSSFASLSPIQKNDVEQLSSLELVSFSTNCIRADNENYCARRFTISEPVFNSSSFKFLDLAYNNFTSVPSYLFQTSLIGIKLRGNPLNWIRSNDFANATNIKYLNAAWTSQYIETPLQIEKDSFVMLKKLEILDLSANMISNFPNGFLRKNTKLKALNLEFNCLKMIEVNPVVLPTLNFLEELSIGGNTFCNDTLNPVKQFQPRLYFTDAFLRFPNLTTLSLGKVKQLPNSEFDESFLYKYFVYGSKYDRVDIDSFKVFKHYGKLKYMDLIGCGIRVLNTRAFDGLKFKDLDLRMNQIGEESKYANSNFRFKRHNSNQKMQNAIPEVLLDEKVADVYLDNNSLSIKSHIQIKQKAIPSATVTLSKNSITSLQTYPLTYFNFVTHLDLSHNKIVYIREDDLQNLTMLQILDLRYNPIRYVHPKALIPLQQLTNIQLNLTEYQQEFTIKFLNGSHQNLTLKYGDIGSYIYALLYIYGNQSLSFPNLTAIDLSYVKVPHYFISKNQSIFKPLPYLTFLKMDGAQITFKPHSNFFSGVTLLQHLSMRECWLEEFPYIALKPLKRLTYLDLSHNKIEILTKPLNFILPNLKTLLLSYNFIYKIEPGTLQLFLNNGMRKFDVSFNQIKFIDPSIFSRDVIQEMELDLRGNAVRCDCSLSDTFGWLIQSNKLNNSKLPGFLPDCSPSVMNYYGDCIACDQSTSDHPLSLFTYTITNNCRQLFLIHLVAWFNSIIVVFLAVALSSKVLKRQLLNLLLSGIRMQSSLQRSETKETSTFYAYDGFVYYDQSNESVANWVDRSLVTYLETSSPSFRLSVVGKEDWCGTTQVQQLLLRMNASRKTIVILSEKFISTPQCQYVLSLLEEWIYVKREKKCILINFDADSADMSVKKIFQKGPSRHNPYSMLNYSQSENNPLFWDVLTNAMIL